MLIEGCKHELEITVPADEVERQTDQVIAELQKKVRLRGFRPGKAPASLIRSQFADTLRNDVLEKIVPIYLERRFKEEELRPVGRPNISDVHLEKGEPLRFKARFEVAPEIELGEYRGIPVQYLEPTVSDEDIGQRLEQLREQKAQYVNVDPRPVENGDHVVVSLESLSGIEPPVQQDEMVLHVGDADTLPAFTEALLGMSPEEEKEFEVEYPEDSGQERFAGKTVRFRAHVKMIRLKELPELNDDFAQDLGDFQTLNDLREEARKAIYREREVEAQNKAKQELIDKLVDQHDFPVPEAFADGQVDAELDTRLRQLKARGIDPEKIDINWAKVRQEYRPKAIREVKASLLLDKIAERESIAPLNDEVDREVQRLARQLREPVAAVRKKLEKDGTLGRIAYQIRTNKTLSFLFENARKEASA